MIITASIKRNYRTEITDAKTTVEAQKIMAAALLEGYYSPQGHLFGIGIIEASVDSEYARQHHTSDELDYMRRVLLNCHELHSVKQALRKIELEGGQLAVKDLENLDRARQSIRTLADDRQYFKEPHNNIAHMVSGKLELFQQDCRHRSMVQNTPGLGYFL